MIQLSFSFVTIYESYLRRCFAAAGLFSQTVQIDPETTIHFWGPWHNPAKPNLVLIHGFGPIAIWQWRRQVQYFHSAFNVYVPDLVFFGRSVTTSAERSEKFQAISIGKLLLDYLKLRRFHVVGTSYGGFVAYRMAEMWPENVDKVVIASSGVNMRLSNNQELLKRAGRGKIEELLLPTTAEQLVTLMELAVFTKRIHMVPKFILNDIINKLYAENRKEKLELLKGLTLGKEETPQVSFLNQDVLLLWGEHDQLFPLEMATELKELIGKKVKLEVMKNTSHVPQIEDHARFNTIVNSFLRWG